MAEDWTTFLLRYGELAVKSDQVRRRFEDRLEANLKQGFAREGVTALVDRTWGRFFVETPDPEAVRGVLSRTFGLVHASPVDVLEADLDAITAYVRGIASDHVDAGQSFAIRARRTGDHDFESPDIEETCGAAVLEAVPGAEVDLDDPDETIHVEVRKDKAYVFTEFVDAPGGLPRGSQGRVVVPFEGPRSPATAWLTMRRGASVHGVVPSTGTDLVEVLEPWAPGMTYTVLEAPVQCDALVAAAERLAETTEASAIALGEHEALAEAGAAREFPVLRPLAGLPGKRWPEGAYRVAKQAADVHPGRCVDKEGLTADEVLAELDEATTAEL